MSIRERLQPLFHPRGIIVTGVSQHPGKFGTVTLHNLLRFGYKGKLFPVSRNGEPSFGQPTYTKIADIPKSEADLVFLCTPPKLNLELLRQCSAIGVRAAFVASGGYGEAGEEGQERQVELLAAADDLNLVLAGPNGQGLISTAESMCAQIVPPYPPAGSIAMVSQSGNLATSFMNYGRLTGVGFSKGISCGNSAQLGIADYLEYFAQDEDTAVSLVYMESVDDGRRFLEVSREHTARKPLVVVRGGRSVPGKRAATSHTGALATNNRIFDSACRQAGITRVDQIEEAYEVAASFATQPLPLGPRTLVFTVAGGWGVLTADACSDAGIELLPLPEDLRDAISQKVPPRWSRRNPIDLAGGETRDTIPEILELAAAHPEVDAIVYTGIGIQAAQGELFRSGPFFPEHGLERMAEFHERQDRRYGTAAAEASERHQKPVLVATDLVYTDRDYGNAGPHSVIESGRLCYPSGHRAIRALSHMVRYADYRRRRASH